MLKSLLLLLIIAPVSGLCQRSTSVNRDSSRLEDKILDAIIFLPEVVQEDKYVRSKSGNKRHLSDFILRRPSKDFKYYWVYVGEDNGWSFANHFHFYVDPQSLSIKFYDTSADKAIDLKTWRQAGKQKR